MSKCISGKICHETQQFAEEALLENRIRFNHPMDRGPINVYQCDDCGYFHFTSKGGINPIIKESTKHIKTQQEARNWEKKLR